MFNIYKFKPRPKKISKINPNIKSFQHKVIGPIIFHPGKKPDDWGFAGIPTNILLWIVTNMNISEFVLGSLKFIDGNYKFIYHFKNQKDAVEFKLLFG